jgi:hypothetical protein
MNVRTIFVAVMTVPGLLGLTGMLTGCQSMPTQHQPKDGLEIVRFQETPLVGQTGLRLGGFSGFVFEGFRRLSGHYDFMATTSRGPLLDVRKDSGEKNLRPFVEATYAPRWVTFSYNPKKGVVENVDQIILKSKEGKALTGLPKMIGADETPIDKLGHRVALDRYGIDPGGLAQDSDGSYWMCEQYRPSLLHFNSNGSLLQRWVPNGLANGTGAPQLPIWYTRRQMNHGFSGVALDGDQVVAFLRSPLKNDFDVTRLLSVDKTTGQPRAEYAYPFENSEEGRAFVDQIGDSINIGPGRFLVVEQNSAVDERGFHRVYEIDIHGASNLLSRNGDELSRSVLCSDGTLDSKEAETCVKPVKKKLIADLVALGLHGFAKIEGLAVIDSQTLALVNDNEFDVKKTGAPTALFIVHLATPLR